MKKLDKLFQKWTIMAVILPAIDVITTILFTSKYGISAEANPIGVFFMRNFGSLGFIFMYMMTFIVLILSFKFMTTAPFYVSKILKLKVKNKYEIQQFGVKLAMYILTAIYVIVYIINISSLWQI